MFKYWYNATKIRYRVCPFGTDTILFTPLNVRRETVPEGLRAADVLLIYDPNDPYCDVEYGYKFVPNAGADSRRIGTVVSHLACIPDRDGSYLMVKRKGFDTITGKKGSKLAEYYSQHGVNINK